MPPPKQMRYDSQAIICLDPDFERSARARQIKREEAGDGKKSELFLNGTVIGELPPEYRQPNSRLIIMGHGSRQSDEICTAGDVWWPPVELAKRIKIWLGGNRIKHISLVMCYGGGNRDGKGAFEDDSWMVSPKKSFAYELARHCGYAETISARTDRVGGIYRVMDDSGEIDRRDQVIYNLVGVGGGRVGRYKKEGDKVVYKPNKAATPDHPVDPAQDISRPWKDKAEPF